MGGLEPPTPPLTAESSAIELHKHYFAGEPGLEPRTTELETSMLPLNTILLFVQVERVELSSQDP